jgi:DegV family protein with EDD domain
MSGRVAIVTDSTASIPADVAGRLDIVIVPAIVHVGDRTVDEDETGQDEILEAMANRVPVSTSPPAPPSFFWAYQDAMAAGAETIVSIHLSEKLSRTCESARLAAEQMPIPVHVVDARSIAMAVGYVVVAAAEAADARADLREIATVVEHRRTHSTPLFYVDTLEYLRRGGRIGKASALVGTALELKPLLTVEDGLIAPLTRVRKAGRAITRLEEIAVERAGTAPVDIAVHHVGAADGADALAQRLQERLPSVRNWCINPVSWAVGVHSGPGMLGVVVARR